MEHFSYMKKGLKIYDAKKDMVPKFR